MRNTSRTALFTALLLCAAGNANADTGVGVKVGTLGLGLEGRWSPLPWLDLRLGANQYDFNDTGSRAGINYDGEFRLDTLYLTGNVRFPLSPLRVTAGVFSNNNEVELVSQDTGGANFNIGGVDFSSADVGSLQSTTSFEKTAPYVGVGYDFEIFGKVGLNFDVGMLWQGEPSVSLIADGLASTEAAFLAALEEERLEIEDDVSNYKAFPVLSLGLVYNF